MGSSKFCESSGLLAQPKVHPNCTILKPLFDTIETDLLNLDPSDLLISLLEVLFWVDRVQVVGTQNFLLAVVAWTMMPMSNLVAWGLCYCLAISPREGPRLSVTGGFWCRLLLLCRLHTWNLERIEWRANRSYLSLIFTSDVTASFGWGTFVTLVGFELRIHRIFEFSLSKSKRIEYEELKVKTDKWASYKDDNYQNPWPVCSHELWEFLLEFFWFSQMSFSTSVH